MLKNIKEQLNRTNLSVQSDCNQNVMIFTIFFFKLYLYSLYFINNYWFGL